MSQTDATLIGSENSGSGLFGSPYIRWGLLALIQLALIAIPIADRLYVQVTGEEVTLALAPVDPRDLLRGDYVILNLSLHTLPRDLPGAGADIVEGETVYVRLQADDDGIARPAEVARERSALNGTVIEAAVERVEETILRINTGMDAFFVQEGDGKEVERIMGDRVKLIAAIASDGRSLPLQLLIDGKVFKSDGAL